MQRPASARRRSAAAGSAVRFDPLEPRRLFATTPLSFVVSDTSDAPTDPGSLRYAVDQANAAPGEVQFDAPVAGTTLRPNVIAGRTDHGSATVDVSNTGSSRFDGEVNVQVFAEQSGSLVSTASPLGTLSRLVRLRAGATAALHVPVQITDALAAGTYHLIATATGPAGLASPSTRKAVVVTVAAAAADFSERVIAPPNLGETLARGHPAAVRVLVRNGGNAAGVPATISLFGSPDDTFSDSTLIMSRASALSLRPGQSRVFTFLLAPSSIEDDTLADVFAQVAGSGQTTTSAAAPI